MDNINKIKNINILQNVFLATPLTIEGLNALQNIGQIITTDSFLDNCYVQPFTSMDLINKDDNNHPIDYDIINYTYKEESYLNQHVYKKEIFENNFYETFHDSIFIIKGVAGSGKTTYVNRLLHKHDKNIISLICDFERVSKSVYLINEIFDIGRRYQKTIWKFISLLLPNINHFLQNKDLDENIHKNTLSDLINIYKMYFANYKIDFPLVDNVEYIMFFDIINNYTENKYTYEKFSNRINDYFNSMFEKYDDNPIEAVNDVFGILIRLFFCLSKTEKYNGKIFICAIDNIERYIDNTLIQDIELQDILSSINDIFLDYLNKLSNIRKESNLNHCSFKILLSMRETTANLSRSQHYIDKPKNELYISNWYNIRKVYEKKSIYFRDIFNNNNINNDELYIAFKNIFSDESDYKWGTSNLVSMMYNNNKRRIANNTILALARMPESILKQYNNNWKNAIETKNPSTKYLCRKLILRVILDYIQETNYLDKVLINVANIYGDDGESNSYARKITTYLSNITTDEDEEKYVSFPKIIKNILHRPYYNENDINEIQIRDLAKTLFTMNLSNRDDTNWSPLIVIKFEYKSYIYEEDLIQQLINSWKNYLKDNIQIENVNEFAIKITAAGKTYAKFVPDFEYYASRYANKFKPLMTITDQYECYELLNIVQKNAFRCINNIIRDEEQFFSSMGQKEQNYSYLYNSRWLYKENDNNTYNVHPMRILNHHIGYLEHYLIYLLTLIKNINEKNEMIYIIQDTIKKYKNKVIEIENNYPNYLKK